MNDRRLDAAADLAKRFRTPLGPLLTDPVRLRIGRARGALLGG